MADGKLLTSYLEVTEKNGGIIMGCEKETQNLQNVTTSTYESIAENLPKIIDKIDNDNEEANALIDYFLAGDDTPQGESVVNSTLGGAKKIFEEVSGTIHDLFKKDQYYFKQIKTKIDQIETLRKSILEIASISDDIELLSYNSVFVASQAGASGKAFTYIATEIKSLSNQTKKLAYKMRESSDELVENYQCFNQDFEKINQDTNQQLDHLDQNLSMLFNKYTEGLKTVAELIKQTLQRSSDTKRHVPAIMVGLQVQDLVRQLLEQISSVNSDLTTKTHNQLLLNVNNPQGENNPETAIEESCAKSAARTSLAVTMLDKVVSSLRSSVHDFKGYLRELRDELKDIDADRIAIIDFFANEQTGLDGNSSIGLIFDESSKVLKKLIDFFNLSTGKKREAGHYANTLKENLNSIEVSFGEMSNIIRQFNVIKVVSKMEISRETALSDNISASSQMFEELTHKMDENISDLRSQLDFIKKDINVNLEQLADNIVSQEQIIQDVQEKIQSSVTDLNTMRDNLTNTIRAVGQESSVLFELIDNSIKGTTKIEKIVDTSQSLRSRYQSILNDLESFHGAGRTSHPKIFNRSTAVSRFPELVEIDQKFTAYSDNNQNGSSFETANEVNEAAGELVLF